MEVSSAGPSALAGIGKQQTQSRQGSSDFTQQQIDTYSTSQERKLASSPTGTSQRKVVQIYVKSEDNTMEMEAEPDTEVYPYGSMGRQFSMADQRGEYAEGTEKETDATSPELTYNSLCHYYRQRIADDITHCNKAPSILLEIISSIFAIINIIVAFQAFHDISYQTTGVYYNDYIEYDNVLYHGETIQAYASNANLNTIHIYKEAVFVNWRNFVYLGLCLSALEVAAPVIRLLAITDRGPKKIVSIQTLLQVSLLISLVLEDGAISLCKNMLFAEECGIRPALMSSISQTSASLSFLNAVIKSALFLWRSNFRNQRAVRDEMEAYTEILILEEYQCHHCIIPILTHIAVVVISIWSLIDATTANLICAEKN